jgi:hypothetical protein
VREAAADPEASATPDTSRGPAAPAVTEMR